MSEPLHPKSPAIPPDVRVALYHRLHWLWPLLAGRSIRILGWGLFAAWLAFAILVLALRYAVLPKIGEYQGAIEQVGRPQNIRAHPATPFVRDFIAA